MEPDVITAAEWSQLAALVQAAFWFAALALVSALSFLLAHAAIPSLVATRQLTPETRLIRWGAYGVGAVALLSAVFTFGLVLGYAMSVLGRLFPRWWI